MRIGTDMTAVRTAGDRAAAAALGRRFAETAPSKDITFGSSLLAMGDGRPEEERGSESGEEGAAVDTTDAQKIRRLPPGNRILLEWSGKVRKSPMDIWRRMASLFIKGYVLYVTKRQTVSAWET